MRNTAFKSGLTEPLAKRDEVSLRVAVTKDGIEYPAGTLGAIIWRYPDGKAFEVELFSPQPAVVTVLGQDLI